MKRVILFMMTAAALCASRVMADEAKAEPNGPAPIPVTVVVEESTNHYNLAVNEDVDDVKGAKAYVDKYADNVQNDKNFKAYAAGISIAQQLTERMLPSMKADFTDTPDSINQQLAIEGFMASLQKNTSVMTNKQAEDLFNAKRAANKAVKEEKLYGANRKAGEDFLAENAKKEGVVTLPSGLQYKVLTKGTGEKPQATDRVQVHYEGRLVDGTVFDASKKHGDKPLTFAANQVIKGWTEALCLMPVGSKWELYIPYQLAYGERDMGTIKPYSALIFTVELLGIEK